MAVDPEGATVGCHAIGEASQSGAVLGDGASDAVVDDDENESAPLVEGTEHDLGGPGMFDGVGEPFTGGEVGGGLDIGRVPIAVGEDLDGQRCPAGQVS